MSKQARNRPVFLRIENLEKRENPAPIVPVYNSNPTAFAQLYLDFDGNTGPAGWCGTGSAIVTSVFGTDADPNNFSATELNIIDQIWKRIAEDYVPFKINVTTVVPSDFNDKHAVRLAIGGQSGGINWSGVGGVGCLTSFYSGGSSNNIAFVHSPNLGNNAKSVAMATSHEAGHTFNLGHQDNPPCGGYHAGAMYNGEYKGPLMGAPYNATRELWWLGFEGCGTQNDMAIISNTSNGFGYVADDISAVPADARRLRNNAGTLAGNLTGVIHQTTDADWFFFGSPAGNATITLSAAALGPNFDGILELYQDVAGVPVLLTTADPAGVVLGATINFSVPAGKKYLVVKSDGDYGEVGAYSLSGSVPSSGLLPGIGNGVERFDTHPMASLFEPVTDSGDENAPAPKDFVCGCPTCVAAAAGARLNTDQITASTAALKRLDTLAHSAVAHTVGLTAKNVTSTGVTDNVTVESAKPLAATTIQRVLKATAATGVLVDDIANPVSSAL